MLSKTQLANQLVLQDRLNSVVDPLWLTAGHQWHRAIMVEAVEALDHYGWKWWKKQAPDVPQVQIELADIWHFILSATLVECQGDHVWAAESLITRMGGAETFSEMSGTDTRKLFDELAGSAASGGLHSEAFVTLLRRLELPWDKLHVMYVAKNVLNIFRQAHGYKEGTYIKVWQGQEDNVVLANLLYARPDATAEQLLTKLEEIYTHITKETA